MTRTGVPGMAVAVVCEDQVVHLEGYGVREAGTSDRSRPTRSSTRVSVKADLIDGAGRHGRRGVRDWDSRL